MLQLKVKLLHPDAKLPTRAHATDSGWDVYTISHLYLEPRQVAKVPLGIAIEPPPGYEVQGRPRSSSLLRGLYVQFSTVDQGYRGEVCACVANIGDQLVCLHPGERILQLVLAPLPACEVVQVDGLSPSDRGEAGHGSSGR